MSNGRHHWTADEPVSLGGTDTGPNPYELLLASLAACTCITLSYYCRRKGIALESVSATYDFSRVHAEDCKDSDSSDKGLIDRITSIVHITGDFDDAQRRRLAEIVTRCPVHKTLTRPLVIDDNTTFS
jgi:putative redox protein